jgi:NADH-quinone oxidoreductase subunit N
MSNESGFKYFLMGSFATGFLLFGITLIYGVTGSFDLITIQQHLSTSGETGLAIAGVLLLLVGLSFKSSLAPFHFWAPDVYEGAPTTITTYMATVVKTAAFAAFFRLFSTCFAGMAGNWTDVIWWMVVLTLFVGNISAVRQKSLKRMLAYSSVAHAGYIAIAIASLSAKSASAIFFYTFTYSISSISAFTILFIVSRHKGSKDILAFQGIGKANPLLSFAMTVSVLSLAGIPPTAGFFAKYYIFLNAINNGNTLLVLLAVIAMYTKPEQQLVPIPTNLLQRIVLVITTILTLLFGLFPNLVLMWM